MKDRLTKEINYWDHRAEEPQAAGTGWKAECPAELAGGSAEGDDCRHAFKRLDELQKSANWRRFHPW